jgi:hypothetical protein
MALLLFALESGGMDNITIALVPYPIAGEGAETPDREAPEGAT